jgi:hypothetical protein
MSGYDFHHSRGFFLLGGIFLLFGTQKSLADGRSLLGLMTVKRDENTSLYWFGVCAGAAAGIGCLLLVLFDHSLSWP